LLFSSLPLFYLSIGNKRVANCKNYVKKPNLLTGDKKGNLKKFSSCEEAENAYTRQIV